MTRLVSPQELYALAAGLIVLGGLIGSLFGSDPLAHKPETRAKDHTSPLRSRFRLVSEDSDCSRVCDHAVEDDEKAKDAPLKLPEWWNPKDPLPIVKSNCVRCHLTAGRELTAPLRDFARSVHDFAKLSCNDCHGGNTEEDLKAHEEEFDFIGTKLSAHMQTCMDCHHVETEGFRQGKHYWDLSKSINRDYPACLDCHGNHDVAKPPPGFALMNVCTDCHKEIEKEMPATAAVVAENDALWKVLTAVHEFNKKEANPTPEEFRNQLKKVRRTTSLLIHRATPATEAEAEKLNGRVKKLRKELESWLKENARE